MAAIVGKFHFRDLRGQVTIRYLGPVVRIVLDCNEPSVNGSYGALLKDLESLAVKGRTEVFDLATVDSHSIFLAGDLFGEVSVPYPAGSGKVSIKTAEDILEGLKRAAPALLFDEIQSYTYV